MYSEGTSTHRTRGRALQGGIVTLILIGISTLSFKAFGHNFVFTAIPIITVFLWPRGADPSLSVICLFFVGLVHDMLSFGLAGFWPLLYLFYFIIFRPDRHRKNEAFWLLWGKYLMFMILGFFLIWALGSLFMQRTPDLKTLITMLLISVVLFPVVFLAGKLYKRIFGEYDDGGGGYTL